MASRYTDTEIWNEDWFCAMPGEYQLFVKYVWAKCDNAGVWKPNKIDFESKTKFKVSPDLLFKKMNEGGGGSQRVLLLDNGRWFFTGYILFQWFNKKKSFDLVLSNRLHKSLYDILIENKVPLPKVRGLKEVLKTSMVMVMDNKRETVINQSAIVPTLVQQFKDENPDYPYDQTTDFPAVREISEKILLWAKLPGTITDATNCSVITERWKQLLRHVKADQHYRTYSLTRINKHFQSIAQSFVTSRENPAPEKSKVDPRQVVSQSAPLKKL